MQIVEDEMLQGYKTYLAAVLIALATFGKVLGWIDQSTYDAILALLASLGLYGLRSAINNK